MSDSIRVLCLGGSANNPSILRRLLRQAGYQVDVQAAGRIEDLDAALLAGTWDLVFGDHAICKDRVRVIVDRLEASRPHLPLILLADEVSQEAALAAIREGAQELLARSDLASRLPLVAARDCVGPPDSSSAGAAWKPCQRWSGSISASSRGWVTRSLWPMPKPAASSTPTSRRRPCWAAAATRSSACTRPNCIRLTRLTSTAGGSGKPWRRGTSSRTAMRKFSTRTAGSCRSA